MDALALTATVCRFNGDLKLISRCTTKTRSTTSHSNIILEQGYVQYHDRRYRIVQCEDGNYKVTRADNDASKAASAIYDFFTRASDERTNAQCIQAELNSTRARMLQSKFEKNASTIETAEEASTFPPPQELPESADIRSQTGHGFPNLGNTCYASAAIKFLCCSNRDQGKALSDHLFGLQRDPNFKNNESKLKVLEAFYKIVEQYRTGEATTSQQLKNFYSLLQTQEGFINTLTDKFFRIIGKQQDSQEFLGRLSAFFKLELLPHQKIEAVEKLINPHNVDDFRVSSSTTPPFHTIHVNDELANAGFQALIDTLTSSEDVEMKWDEADAQNRSIQKTWCLRTNVEELSHVNIYLDTCSYTEQGTSKIQLTHLDFEQEITLEVTDTNEKEYSLTIQAHTIVAQRGSAQGGHYVMYEKQDDQWRKYDDTTVSVENPQNASFQPTLISFKVLRTVENVI